MARIGRSYSARPARGVSPGVLAAPVTPGLAFDSAPAVDSVSWRMPAQSRTVQDVAGATDVAGALKLAAPPVATLPNPNWPVVGFDVDFTQGPPGVPGAARQSLNRVGRRLVVRSWSTSRGRQYELDQVQAGTCEIDVPDPLEMLNPDSPSSPYNVGDNAVTAYRAVRVWGMWPNQPGSGNIFNPTLGVDYRPDFEAAGSADPAAPWVVLDEATTRTVVTEQHHSGSSSLKVVQAAAGAGHGVAIVPPTVPALDYTWSVWVRPTGGCTVMAQVVDAGGDTTQSAVAAAQNVWTRIFFNWQTVDTAEQIIIFGAGVANPTFYVDDYQLEFGPSLSDATLTGPVLYPQFTGYVERWPTNYDMSGTRAQRPLQAVDALAILSRTAIAQSYDAEIAADTPMLYHPMSNQVSPNTGAELGKGPNGFTRWVIPDGGSINWGSDAAPDGTPAVTFANQNPGGDPARGESKDAPAVFPSTGGSTEMTVQGGFVSLDTAGGFMWELWVRYNAGTIQFGTLELLDVADPHGLNWNVPTVAALGYGGQLRFALRTGIAGSGASYGLADSLSFETFDDGEWHYMWQAVVGARWYVAMDGDALGYLSITPGGSAGGYPRFLGFNTLYHEASSQFGEPQAQGSVSRWAVYNYAWSIADMTARRLAHYQRGIGYKGERSGARVARLLDKYWKGPRGYMGGYARMAPDFSYDTRTMLDVLQEIGETERAVLFADVAGAVQWPDRDYRYLDQEPVAVFGEDPDNDESELPYSDYSTDHDPTYVFTQANLTRPDNSNIAPMVDQAAQDRYGQRILTQELQVNTDFDVEQAGIFYLARYGAPRTRITKLTLRPAANPSLWPVVLGLELQQRVRVFRRSPALSFSHDYYVEKIEIKVVADTSEWTVDLQLSPVFVDSAWVLEDPTRGVLGQTTVPIF